MSTTRKKNGSDENLLRELQALKAQVNALENQVRKQSKTSEQKKSTDFLLSEFNELGQFWRHTDARLESGLNLYMTASALIVSGLVYLSQQVTDFRAFMLFITLVAFALFVGGVILAERILGTAFTKAEYTLGLNLLRRYFVDIDSSIKDYLILPTADSPKDDKVSTAKRFVSPRIPTFLLRVVHVWDSLLLGFVISSIYWLALPQTNIKWLIAIGVIIALACFSTFSAMVWFRKRKTG